MKLATLETPAVPNRILQELAAMEAIAEALSQLNDPGATDRVLRWAAEHFAAGETVSTSEPAAPPVPSQPSQPLQIVARDARPPAEPADPENLDSLFEVDATRFGLRPAQETRPQPVESMLSSFVSDFQKLADDWQRG